ncbi:DUF5107 domain-containing protein [Crossiella sp. CA-258035]|uniref:DUF5107 domain-containing protein n=1 Tax=Crossiella sp. CA-258035 TaxID=2981138 RepID=UPI0024BC682E|nr:DUF5107 domain-containing protein [Crossiella sp. CA-258035]WHT22253.1 DUF5107 domain-containing protein [Crossiella sp. CA-258035]
MTTIEQGRLTLPVSAVGPENPLPPLAGLPDGPGAVDLSEVPADLAAAAAYGHVRGMLPYLTQDSYRRAPEESTVDTVVLDNGLLRASFVPALGGRLWSLVDLAEDRELLHVPRLLQPANLALRNAWFAGGVEWNIGTRGHSPFTCAPLHAAQVRGPGGVPALRMWEFERLRGLVFQVDAWLAEGSPVLHVGVRVHNPQPHEVPMYWWSNTAVTETPRTRVLAPSTSAFRTHYSGKLSRVDVPVHEGLETTYPAGIPDAADFFHDLPEDLDGRPWIAALDEQGYGLAQASTGRLRGRKLFCWGGSVGGRHWQEWLGGQDTEPYCEIQAGLARTQYEHLPMPAGADWTWVETYGPLRTDPALVHGDWTGAVAEVERALAGTSPADCLRAALHEYTEVTAKLPPVAALHTGSGWGALERHRRAEAGESPLPPEATPFAEGTLGPEQAPWLALLRTGELPEPGPASPPMSYVDGPDWAARLAAAPEHWATAYHRGVLAHGAGALDEAADHYRRSLELSPSPWAARALALVAAEQGELTTAADLLRQALGGAPLIWQLAVETVSALLKAGDPAAALTVLDALAPEVAGHGRVQLLRVQAHLAAGERGRAAGLLRAGIEVPDLREGEISLDHLWAQACPETPLPARYDFRMHV